MCVCVYMYIHAQVIIHILTNIMYRQSLYQFVIYLSAYVS